VQAVIPMAPMVTAKSGLQDGGSPLGSLGQVFLTWPLVSNAQTYSMI
jgi:hypothetical protein